ncbi:MAG TPA: 2-amino-4-hydroxy-6-hydroxymethyldihydropteridine diphosphokinase [Methylomirabilota bacterium]|nr:2-amino-4-hydroxy-6-hydroxymethyldihydropteridine diphosphokinase [Methylomirabilota bacterium]
MHIIFLALGSNIENKKENINKAIKLLEKHVKNISVAKLYETKPMYLEQQDTFLNTVLKGETKLSPIELLNFAKQLEKQIGRKERFRNGPREIDIDILFYNNLIFKNETLQIPHPKIAERDFVLKPFMDLDSNFIHPVLKKTIQEIFNKSGE